MNRPHPARFRAQRLQRRDPIRRAGPSRAVSREEYPSLSKVPGKRQRAAQSHRRREALAVQRMQLPQHEASASGETRARRRPKHPPRRCVRRKNPHVGHEASPGRGASSAPRVRRRARAAAVPWRRRASGELDQLLAEIAARQQSDEGLGRRGQAVRDGFSVLDPARRDALPSSASACGQTSMCSLTMNPAPSAASRAAGARCGSRCLSP